ncbi:oxidoreductase [Actinoalloteichus hymeniacidonis]|uniref:Short-chain alcohol dehydrogenase n=1 Tax=Actinoalloteichus hymeniacidonis TaxID=340345 RepID=A0AAC9HV83_9PSEU|nr:oxidoreductase [Actinoalloteichus hymeniacidonis]AOS65165.1 short-chain dehydrogenase of unknown substrate specificity [Actinoalloteichus hymeniacidonis]MBB5906756.1 protochlorophyllide reductase [Actinoalloteichus hymeniacidonis]
MAKWTITDIPDQAGRVVLITGANSGLGRASALALASRNAHVLVGARSVERGTAVVDKIRSVGGQADLVEVDVSDLDSVRRAVEKVAELAPAGLDVLMNNAGVMGTPLRRTEAGHELQLATNHLGPAALTWLLMPQLRKRPGARVVTLASIAHKGSGLDLDDLNFNQRRYSARQSYSQTKLANLLFMSELDRRLRADGSDVLSIGAHPGWTDTDLSVNSARMRESKTDFLEKAVGMLTRATGQSVEQGVLPQLYAATMPDARGGDYFGPDGPGEVRGAPKRVAPSAAAQSISDARRLWEITAELTGVRPDPA